MTTDPHSHDDAHWSLAGLAKGAWMALPVLPSTAMYGAAFGAVAAQKGLTLSDATLMSAIVFAGAAQLVAMEIWSNAPTLAVIASLALVTAAGNMRFLLMSAALPPWFGGLPAWQAYPMLFFATDPGWLMSMRYRAEGVSDVGLFVGTGMVVWVTWAGATVPGYLLGALAADPRRFGLDAIMPALFTALLVP